MDLLGEAADLIRQIEPPLCDVPIYLLDAGQYRLNDQSLDALGFTNYWLDVQTAPQLQERGLWEGHGFCAALFMDRIPKRVEDVTAIALHELAHFLTFPSRPGDYSDLERSSAMANKQVSDANAGWIAQDLPPWAGHELPFVRAACHLAHRAMGVLESIRPWSLRFSHRYYLIDEMVWMRVLRDELQQLEHMPIRDIIQTIPASHDAKTLWRLATSWWPAMPP